MIVEWRRLIARATIWFLRSKRLAEPTERGAQRLTPAVAHLRTRLEPEAAGLARVGAWVQAGVPLPLAQQVGAADRVFSALDIAEVAEAGNAPLDVASAVHFGIGERPGLEKLRQQIELLPADSHWQTLAKVALTGDLNDLHNSIALDAVRGHPGTAAEKLESWEARNCSRFRAGEAPAGRAGRSCQPRSGDAVGGAARTAQPGMTRLASGQAHQLPCMGQTLPIAKEARCQASLMKPRSARKSRAPHRQAGAPRAPWTR